METPITALLVDDEQDSREVLRSLLMEKAPEIHIVGEAAGVEEAYELIGQLQPQLVFLDVQMPRGSGFNLLKLFDVPTFEVIFVTSFDQYAINAIRFNALDYLLKPVDPQELTAAVKKAAQHIQQHTRNDEQVIHLLNHLDPAQSEQKLAVHAGEAVKFIHTRDVLYIEADGRYCHLLMHSGERYVTAKYLKDYEDYLGAASPFVRVNKSLLINTNGVKEYSKGDPCFVTLINGQTFEIARRKKTEILGKLKAMKG